MKSKQQLLSHFFIFAAQLVQYRLHLHHVEFSFFFFQTLWLFFFFFSIRFSPALLPELHLSLNNHHQEGL